jgi:hypothetical protein
MRQVRRTTITVETHEVWSIAREHVRVKCTECDAQMTTPEAAATIAGTCIRTVYRLIEAGMIHYVETPAGTVHVCVVSLLSSHDVMAILSRDGNDRSDEPEQ